MKIVTVTRRLEFDAGHRLQLHESKCRNLHGHRYIAEVTVEGPELDAVGRVVDFGVIKSAVGGWIDTHWDHGLLLEEGDWCRRALVEEASRLGAAHVKLWVCRSPPTAENMVKWLAEEAQNVLGHVLRVTHVRLYETPNCWADYAVPPQLRFSTTSPLKKSVEDSLANRGEALPYDL